MDRDKRETKAERLPHVVLRDCSLFADTVALLFPHAQLVLSPVRVYVTPLPNRKRQRIDGTLADDVPTLIDSSRLDQNAFDAAVTAAGRSDGDWIIRGRLCGFIVTELSRHRITDVEIEIAVNIRGDDPSDGKLVNPFALAEWLRSPSHQRDNARVFQPVRQPLRGASAV